MSVCLHPNFYFTIKHLQSRTFQACIHKCIKNLRRGFGQSGVPLWRLCSSWKNSRFMCEYSCMQRIQIIQTRVCFSNNPSIAVGWRLRCCVHRPERAMQSSTRQGLRPPPTSNPAPPQTVESVHNKPDRPDDKILPDINQIPINRKISCCTLETCASSPCDPTGGDV